MKPEYIIDNVEDIGIIKMCSICKQPKFLICFKKGSDKYGRASECRVCGKIRSRLFYIKNKDKIRIRDTKHRNEYKELYWAYNTLKHHRNSGYKVILTPYELSEYAKLHKNCALCGTLLDWRDFGTKGAGPSKHSPTLDRVFNTSDITINNFQILCFTCNSGKQKGSNEEYIEHCMNVLKHNGKIT